jgi:hypothetical protein
LWQKSRIELLFCLKKNTNFSRNTHSCTSIIAWVIEMDIKRKNLKENFLKNNGRYGVISNADRLYHRLMNKISAKIQGTAIDNDKATYLASEAYRNLLIQVEISKAQVLEEARRHSVR